MDKTPTDRIKELEELINVEKRKIANCIHVYADPFYNPEIIKEPYGSKPVTRGADFWLEPIGFRDVEKPRWTQRCNLCGHERHTSKTEQIVVGTKPVF